MDQAMDQAAAVEPTEEPEELQGGGRRPSARRRVLVGAVAVVAVAAVTGGVVLVGGDDAEPVVRQTLCGLPRASGTPLNALLPKGRAGVEERRETPAEGDLGALRTCTITVDGEEALTVRLLSSKAEVSDSQGGVSAGELAGRGVRTELGTAAAVDRCASDPTRVAFVSVMLDPGLFPSRADESAVAAQKRELAALAETLRAEQEPDVCR
ncbi:hypothetical protein [Kitasatospora sp. NPDC093806]|uniref:hypothetical protein n=1 Tax=Kitasatospora sp. NPDC093806 TaxID=3155075 RepID=UPI00343097CF